MQDDVDVLIGAPFLAAPAVIVWQVYTWLKTGEWTSLTGFSGLSLLDMPHPEVSWVGIQKIIDHILNWPLSFLLFIIALAWAFSVVRIATQIQKLRPSK